MEGYQEIESAIVNLLRCRDHLGWAANAILLLNTYYEIR